MKDHICPRCGEPLRKENDEYRCRYCGAVYSEEESDQAESVVRSVLAEAKMEALANRRRVLWDAAHLANISTLKLFRAASDVREVFAEDLLAGFYLAALSEDPAELNAFLLSADWEGSIAKEAIRFCLLSLGSRNVLALRTFVENNFFGKEAEDYLERISEEAARLDEGVYLTSLPRDVFLAYSSADIDKVVEIADELEANGLKVFVAARNLRHGKGAQENYERAIFDAMRHCRCIVFLSSESSRNLSCDALRVELPFANDNLPRAGKIEYLLEPYGKGTKPAATIILKNAFKGKEWCTDKEDLLARILSYTTNSDKICFHCGEINDAKARHCHQCGYPLNKDEYEARVLEEKRKEDDTANLEKERQRLEEERERLRKETGAIAEEAVKKLRQEIEAANNSCSVYITSILPGYETALTAHISRIFDSCPFTATRRELQSLPAVFPSPISDKVLSYDEACSVAFQLCQSGAALDVRETRTGKMLRTYQADVAGLRHRLRMDKGDEEFGEYQKGKAIAEVIGCDVSQAIELSKKPGAILIDNISWDLASLVIPYLSANGVYVFAEDMPKDPEKEAEIARKVAEEETKIQHILEKRKEAEKNAPKKPQGYRLVLEKTGKETIGVIKVVIECTGLGLLPAKKMTEHTPATLRDDLTEEKANLFKEKLEKLGAKARVEPASD